MQEHLLFVIIWIGFAVLSLAVVSGSIASLKLTGKILPFDHKTVFTLLSWATFGVLLLGRHVWGWRGRVALRWTLTGFGFLILAYTGSRFVLEMILHRVERGQAAVLDRHHHRGAVRGPHRRPHGGGARRAPVSRRRPPSPAAAHGALRALRHPSAPLGSAAAERPHLVQRRPRAARTGK